MHIFHSSKSNVLWKRKQPASSKIQYQGISETKFRRSQRIIENENDELEIKPCAKRRKFVKKPKTDVESPSCKQCKWIEFGEAYFCQMFQYNNKKASDGLKKLDRIGIILEDFHMP